MAVFSTALPLDGRGCGDLLTRLDLENLPQLGAAGADDVADVGGSGRLIGAVPTRQRLGFGSRLARCLPIALAWGSTDMQHAGSELRIEFFEFVRFPHRGFAPLDHLGQGHDSVAIRSAVVIEMHIIGEKACDDRGIHGIGHA